MGHYTSCATWLVVPTVLAMSSGQRERLKRETPPPLRIVSTAHMLGFITIPNSITSFHLSTNIYNLTKFCPGERSIRTASGSMAPANCWMLGPPGQRSGHVTLSTSETPSIGTGKTRGRRRGRRHGPQLETPWSRWMRRWLKRTCSGSGRGTRASLSCAPQRHICLPSCSACLYSAGKMPHLPTSSVTSQRDGFPRVSPRLNPQPLYTIPFAPQSGAHHSRRLIPAMFDD